MIITQAKAPEQIVSQTGARVGDQVLFSSHNTKNKDLYVTTLNKLYTIIEVINRGGYLITGYMGDDGTPSYHGTQYAKGQYDIITRAPIPEPEFQPVTIVLETREELEAAVEFANRSSYATFKDWVELTSFL